MSPPAVPASCSRTAPSAGVTAAEHAEKAPKRQRGGGTGPARAIAITLGSAAPLLEADNRRPSVWPKPPMSGRAALMMLCFSEPWSWSAKKPRAKRRPYRPALPRRPSRWRAVNVEPPPPRKACAKADRNQRQTSLRRSARRSVPTAQTKRPLAGSRRRQSLTHVSRGLKAGPPSTNGPRALVFLPISHRAAAANTAARVQLSRSLDDGRGATGPDNRGKDVKRGMEVCCRLVPSC